MAWNKKMPIMDGLVCWLDGRDGNNIDKTSVWKDRSGNGNDAILSSNIPYNKTEGWTGKSLKLNRNGYGTITGNSEVCFTNVEECSIEFFFKVKQFGTDRHSVISGSHPLNWYNWVITEAGGTAICIWGGGLDMFVQNGISPNIKPFTEKTHVVIQYKKGTSGYVKVFIDGILKYNLTKTISSFSLSDIAVGRSASVTANTLRGEIFSIKLYNKALTEEEILHNYEYETKYKDKELFLDSEGLRHLTSKIKDTIPSLSTGLPVPYTPELALNGGLTCVYTGKKPIGYEKLSSGNCRPDGTFDEDTDIAGQILEDGSIWFGVGTTNLFTNNFSHYQSGQSSLLLDKGKVKISYSSDGLKTTTLKSGILKTSSIYTSKIKITASNFITKNKDLALRMYSDSFLNNTTKKIEVLNEWVYHTDTTKDTVSYPNNVGCPRLNDATAGDWLEYLCQVEQQPFPTPWVEKTRKQTKLVYPIEVLEGTNLNSKYAVYCEIIKPNSVTDLATSYGKGILSANYGVYGSGTSSENAFVLNTGNHYINMFNKMITGINKVLFINNGYYMNGEYISNSVVNRPGVYSSNVICIFSSNEKQRTWNMPFKKIILFQDKTPFTDEYCKLVTTVGFDIPKCKETAPLYNTEPDTTGLLKYKESYRINDNSETFPIKPNCVYKMTDRNGKEFVNKTNSSNAISAGTGSTLIITNTAGEGKINTGTGYEYPIKVEVVIN